MHPGQSTVPSPMDSGAGLLSQAPSVKASRKLSLGEAKTKEGVVRYKRANAEVSKSRDLI